MFEDDLAVAPAVEHGVLEIWLGLLGLALEVEYPPVSIQVGSVVGVLLHGYPAHRSSLLELFFLQAEVVGIVVQDWQILRIRPESAVVGLKSILCLAELVVCVPDGGKGRHNPRILFAAHLDDSLALVDDFAGGGTAIHYQLHFQVLCIHILRVGLHETTEVFPALFLALGSVEPVPRETQGAAVGRVHPGASGNQAVELDIPHAVEVVVDVFEQLIDIIALRGRVETGILDHVVY